MAGKVDWEKPFQKYEEVQPIFFAICSWYVIHMYAELNIKHIWLNSSQSVISDIILPHPGACVLRKIIWIAMVIVGEAAASTEFNTCCMSPTQRWCCTYVC